jgi:hypothetical protein
MLQICRQGVDWERTRKEGRPKEANAREGKAQDMGANSVTQNYSFLAIICVSETVKVSNVYHNYLGLLNIGDLLQQVAIGSLRSKV